MKGSPSEYNAINPSGWFNRKKYNPANAPRVTHQQLQEFADRIGVEIQRDGGGTRNGMWRYKVSIAWFEAGVTNYLCLETLKEVERQMNEAN